MLQDRDSPRSLKIGNPQALGISTLHCTLQRLEAETLEDPPAEWIRTYAPAAEPLALGGMIGSAPATTATSVQGGRSSMHGNGPLRCSVSSARSRTRTAASSESIRGEAAHVLLMAVRAATS